jgi:hypothetical protein
VVGSATVFNDEGFAERSLMSRRISHFHHAAQLTTTEGSRGGGLGCDEEEEYSSMVGDLDHAPISNRVRLCPNRTGEGEVLRGNEGSRGRSEEESWNSSSYSWESGSNEELGKPDVVGGVVVLGISDSSGFLAVVEWGFLLHPLLLAPKRPRSRGLLLSVDLAYPCCPIYTCVVRRFWKHRDRTGNPRFDVCVGSKKGVYSTVSTPKAQVTHLEKKERLL